MQACCFPKLKQHETKNYTEQQSLCTNIGHFENHFSNVSLTHRLLHPSFLHFSGKWGDARGQGTCWGSSVGPSQHYYQVTTLWQMDEVVRD